MKRRQRMSGADRRQQVLGIAAEEFAEGGLHGASTETIARQAEITQTYIFRMFGTKKALFLEVVAAAFDRTTEGMRTAAGDATRLDALSRMGAQYNELLTDRISLLLQLQGFAACGDPEVRDTVRECFGRMWETVAEVTGLDPVTIKAFLAFGMLLNNGARSTSPRWTSRGRKEYGPASSMACLPTSRPRQTSDCLRGRFESVSNERTDLSSEHRPAGHGFIRNHVVITVSDQSCRCRYGPPHSLNTQLIAYGDFQPALGLRPPTAGGVP